MERTEFVSSSLLIAVVGTTVCASAYAGGFQNSQGSVTGLGRAYAGAGVVGDDLSGMFFNPGSMARIEGGGAQVGISILDSTTEFTNSGTVIRSPAGTFPTPGTDGDGGKTSGPIPGFFYIKELNPRVKLGFGLTAPFGLGTEYESTWVGRYNAIESELQTIDVNPNISYAVNDSVSVGFGVSVQSADAELNQAQFTGIGSPDGRTKLQGDNMAVGYNFGALVQTGAKNQTRLGFGYRSGIEQELEGNIQTSIGGRTISNLDATATVDLPATIYLSAAHQVGAWDFLFGARWTEWSSYDALRIQIPAIGATLQDPQEWDDSWTFSIGANYALNENVIIRGGISNDSTPVPSADLRSPRTPDSDKSLVSLGATIKTKSNMEIDVAYSRSVIDDTNIVDAAALDSTNPAAGGNILQGSYESHANIFGFALRWNHR